MSDGLLDGAAKDEAHVTSDWRPRQDPIDDVKVYEVKNVISPAGSMVTEVFRRDWGLDEGTVDQVFQNVLAPGQVSGWHMHARTIDRLFVNNGRLKVVLYDARTGASSCGRVNTFCFGSERPALLVIPPGVWHAVANESQEPASLLNLVDHAYDYDDPDHWRLPVTTDKIPYSFT